MDRQTEPHEKVFGMHLTRSNAHTALPPPALRNGRHRRTVLILGLLSTAGLLTTFLGLLFLGLSSGGFVVSSGYVSLRSARQRVRACAGVPYEPEWRDGWKTYCVGIPHGPWRCYEQLRDGREELIEVPCN